jgi:hypothetical protein
MAEAKVEKETNVAGPLSPFSLMAYQALWLAAHRTAFRQLYLMTKPFSRVLPARAYSCTP